MKEKLETMRNIYERLLDEVITKMGNASDTEFYHYLDDNTDAIEMALRDINALIKELE
jgi:hypothetical protein